MNLKISKIEKDRVKFNISGIDVSLANALRRIIISEIPTMAIESVTFYENSSILDDEFLALRLGLIPIKTDLAGPDQIKLSLDVRGPCTVYSRDLKLEKQTVKGKSRVPENIMVYDNIPIAKLTENQKIKLEAKAQLGTGKEHMKWQSGIASYEIKKNGSFDFFIESFGQFGISDLIDVAFETFNKKIREMKAFIG